MFAHNKVICQSEVSTYQKQLDAAQSSIDSIDALVQFADWYLYNDHDSCLMYLDRVKEISDRVQDPYGLATYYLILGKFKENELEFELSSQYLKRSCQIADSIDYDMGKEYAYTSLGYLFRRQGQLDSSNFYFKKGFESVVDSLGRASILNGIALNYKSVGAFEEATEAFFEVLRLVDNDMLLYRSTANSNLGLLAESQGKLEDAAGYYDVALKQAEVSENKEQITTVLQYLGDVLTKMGDYEEAERNLIKAKRTLEDNGADYLLVSVCVKLSKLYIMQERWTEAEMELELCKEKLVDVNSGSHYNQFNFAYAKYLASRPNADLVQANKILEELKTLLLSSSNMEAFMQLLQVRSEINRNENPKVALDDITRYQELLDSISNEKNKNYFSMLNMEFETEKKEQKISELEQASMIQSLQISRQRNQLVIGALVAVVLVLGGFIFYRQEKVRKERSAAELEQRFLRSQLNPHFIFNSMTAIQQYLEENEPEGASHYMGMFSTLMRQILENSRQEFISLAEEVSMLENYLQLQQMRFRDQFEYEIEIDEDLDEDYAGVPPMFAQPFIENSLEHGLFRKDGLKNQIRIRFNKIEEGLLGLEIEDSGVGTQQGKVRVNHQSLATRITHERLNKLRAWSHKQVGMKTQNIRNEQGDVYGYRVNLRLPTQLVNV
ncbi:histidine kinase [Reichenbachiella ulvae]|uniref:Histidine kinase n=1 Tax=Reichenbachiella ulvae TaxID=2980104 RepID=A0ABT3CVA1_9BACT|nr:histidine kinase [Reichenbachiella ulvae]MCV9387603.1 histidine kinase [Reichenbachiella ulvae]